MNNRLTTIADSLYNGGLKSRVLVFIVINILIICGGYLVYKTGGTKLSYLHFLYIPVVFSGFVYGPWIGTLCGIIVGIILGPFMPESVTEHIYQSTEAWLFRTFFFVIIGLFAGLFSKLAKAYFKFIEQQYLVDQLTSLPNYKGLEKLFFKQQIVNNISGICLLKLKNINNVERAFGPDLSDHVVQKLVARIKKLIKDDALLSRTSNDSIMIIATNNQNSKQIAFAIQQHLDKSFIIQSIPLYLEIYSGIIDVNCTKISNLKDIIKHSMMAAEDGITSNQEITTFDHTKDYTKPERNMFILHELKKSIANNHLLLHYQPIISLHDHKSIACEALARWNHPDLGAIKPEEFIAVAEKTLLINPYTEWLIDESFDQLSKWHKNNPKLTMSINFSMKNLEDHNLIDKLIKQIKQHNIPKNSIKIEITETAVAQKIDKVAEILHSLKKQNLSIVIDDFGKGQSSLDYLLKLPLDEIKIDQSFIKSMLNNSASDAIIRSAITMANELGLKVTAEGIETKAQLDHLKKLGCHYGQGYFIAKPMQADMLYSWFQSNWYKKQNK